VYKFPQKHATVQRMIGSNRSQTRPGARAVSVGLGVVDVKRSDEVDREIATKVSARRLAVWSHPRTNSRVRVSQWRQPLRLTLEAHETVRPGTQRRKDTAHVGRRQQDHRWSLVHRVLGPGGVS
jgi:hypothetical protein